MKEEANEASLYSLYQTAIRNGVIEDIISSGELYFTTLRRGEMTQEDREQLQKDVLSCVAARGNI